MIKLFQLLKEEQYTARAKDSGKLVYFKSREGRDNAIKAGTHLDPEKDTKPSSTPASAGNSMFGGDYAKDRGGVSAEPKGDAMATVKGIAAKTGLRAQAVAGWADENGVNLSKVSDALNSKKLKPMDLMTAVSGNPGNKYAKDIIAKYSSKGLQPSTTSAPKTNLGVDSVVYNKRTNTIGIVRLGDKRGETKTDADGNVNTDELEPYNPMKYPHQKDAKVAPSTKKEIETRSLWQPFSQSNSQQVSSKLKDMIPNAKEFYKKVSDLTDRNEHSQAAVELAKFMGDKDALKRLERIKKDHDKRGYLSSEDGKERGDITRGLLQRAKENLSKQDYKYISNSF